jgi:glycosyltransferase involved in cell wall biosynthesis
LKWHFYPSFHRVASEIHPDLIHVEEEPYALSAFQAARVARQWGSLFGFFTWENLLTDFGPLHNRLQSYVLSTANYALAGNRDAVDLLVRAGYPRQQIHIIPQYGVNPSLFKPMLVPRLRKKLGLGKFTVGYVGRLIPDKGLVSLVEAFAALGRKDSTLLFLGGGPMQGALEALTEKLGVAGRTRFVSSLPQEAVPEHINAMDVLVLPSLTGKRWKEQFGRVLIEAQACRVPVVGSSSGAIPEVIGRGGLVFPEGDAPALQAHLRRLGSSPALRRRLGSLGYQRTMHHYTNDHLADQIATVQRTAYQSRFHRR